MSDQERQIILCPGQGAQHVGMGQSWAAASPAAKAIFGQADAQLGVDLSTICFEGPKEQLDRTDFAQAAIYVTSVACIAALKEKGEVSDELIAATAGLSLGEYTALHLAGVFSFEDGLDLVWKRGHYMQAAAEASNGGMVALVGADEDQANAVCGAVKGDEVLVPANFNCPGQIVLSGTISACERALGDAENLGVRAVALDVAGAFHSELMQPAAEQMGEALAGVAFSSERVSVLSNVTGDPHGEDEAEVKRLLVEQITQPVRWEANVRWLLANVEGRYIEPAPGKVLMGLMRRTDRKTKVNTFAEAS